MLVEIKKALLDCLKTEFPTSQYKYYSMVVTEQYERPCFFTKVNVGRITPINYNFSKVSATFLIDLFQKSLDEMDIYNTVSKINKALGQYIKTEHYLIFVKSEHWNTIGTEDSMLEMSIEIEWTIQIEHNNSAPLMEHLEQKIENGGQ